MAKEAVAAATPTGALPLGPDADGAVVALAAAARCRRLLMSVVTLTEAGLHDVTGGLLRSIYETWLVGMYAIFGGRPAIGRLLEQVARSGEAHRPSRRSADRRPPGREAVSDHRSRR